MKKRKKYKLKKAPKVLLFILIILIICGIYANNKYQEYLYHQSYEYKLLETGYKKEDVDIMLKKLNNNELDNLLTYEYNEFIPLFLKCKYFMYKNLDGYLSKIVTKEEDFFTYQNKGTTGYDYDELIALVNTHNHENQYDGDYHTNLNDGYSILVNKYYELGGEYVPDDLVDVPLKYYYGDAKKVRSEVYDAFLKMWEAANSEGIYLIIDSAYRSYDSQVEVYKYYEDLKGTKEADKIAARPGYSEHQTGLSLDIYSKECTSAKTFSESVSYNWLINNSYKYGFILRYPKDKKNITGYDYESWHYRYLGVDLATKVYNEGITYDEYYAFYLEK